MKYIKLFEEQEEPKYSMYEIITMPPWKATEVLVYELNKDNPYEQELTFEEYPNVELIQNIIQHSQIEDVNIKNKWGWTVLTWASREDEREIVKLLLDRPEIRINMGDRDGCKTALMWASEWGNTEIVRMLLERPEIRVNMQDHLEWSALMLASENGNTEIVKLLLERPEIDVNLKDEEWDRTALDWAMEEDYTDIADLIQSHPNFNPDL